MRDRFAPDCIVAEGRWAVEALLSSPFFRAPEVLLERDRHPDLVELCRAGEVPLRFLSRDEISGLAGFSFHRGVLGVAERPAGREPETDFLSQARRLLVPVDLADPGNLGTLARSAAAFGVDGIVVAAGRGADIYSPKSLRASATALFRLPVFEVSDLAATLDRISEAGFRLLGTSPGDRCRPLPEVTPGQRTAVLLGSEAEGLPPGIAEACDELVRIPMQGGLDSLNVAVSGGILLWEWFGRESG